MTIIMHVSHLLPITIFDIYDVANVLHYFDACCQCLLHHAYVFFALIVVLRTGIKLGLLIYLVVHQNEVMSGRLVNICTVGNNNC